MKVWWLEQEICCAVDIDNNENEDVFCSPEEVCITFTDVIRSY